MNGGQSSRARQSLGSERRKLPRPPAAPLPTFTPPKPGVIGEIHLYPAHAEVQLVHQPPFQLTGSPHQVLKTLQQERVCEPARCEYLAEFPLPNATLLEVAREYARWITGEAGHRALRDSRLKSGVPEWVTSEKLLAAGHPQSWALSCKAQIRASDRWATVHFRHRDNNQPAVIWENRVLLLHVEGGVQVDHAVLRDSPYRDDMRVTPPTIVKALLEGRPVSKGYEAAALGRPVRLHERDVEAYIKESLFVSALQASPSVVVSGDGDAPWVEPAQLAKSLQGFARVVELVDSRTVGRWNEVLQDTHTVARLFASVSEFRPLTNAAFYIPRGKTGPITFNVGDHWARSASPAERALRLADAVRRNFVQQIRGFAAGIDAHLMSRQEASLADARKRAEIATSDAVEWKALVTVGDQDVETLRREAEEARAVAAVERAARQRAEYELSIRRAKDSEGALPPEVANAMLRVMRAAFRDDFDEKTPRPTAEDVLRLFVSARPDRIAVHHEAWEELRRTGHRLWPLGKWFDQLDRMTTKFYDRWPKVEGIFAPKEYARDDTKPTLEAHPKGRIVTWERQSIVGDMHWRTGEGRTQCGWGTRSGKRILVLTHAGEHLPTVGHPG